MSLSFVLAGGGTGGHVFPLIAVADAIRQLDRDHQVLFVGTRRGLEVKVVPEKGYELELLDIVPIRGMGIVGALRGIAKAITSMPESAKLIRSRKPDVVLSVGGYAAGPVTLAAWMSGVPTALLEPNSEMGLSNLALAAVVDRAYTAFESTDRHFRRARVLRVGVPLRSGFTPRPWVEHEGPLRLLVLGGSQGAASINEMVAKLRQIIELPVEIRHQCGRAHLEHARGLYAEQNQERLSIEPFIDDMPAALAWADIVISRSGASAIGEICAIGRASVLIPFPFAAGDHQAKNARAVADAGAAICLDQEQATAEHVREQIVGLVEEQGALARMCRAAQLLGRPGAAMTIATDMIAIAKLKAGPGPCRPTITRRWNERHIRHNHEKLVGHCPGNRQECGHFAGSLYQMRGW